MDEKIKILYIITKSNWGGAQKYVYDLATSLSPNDYDVTVILGAVREDTIESGKGKLFDALKVRGIKLIPIKEFQRNINIIEEIIIFFKLVKIFLKEKPDVIHVNSSKASGLGVVAGWLTGVKRRIYTVHGWPFNESRGKFSKILIKFFSWLTVLFSTKVIAISENNFNQGLLLTNAKNKIDLVHNGIKTIDFKTKEEARQILIEQIRISGDVVPNQNGLWVGTISELTKNKGVRYLVGSIARLIEEHPEDLISCVIIGGGEEESRLKKIIDEEKLSERVFLAGFIPDASTLIKAFDIATLTSVKEGNPFILLEAGLAKLPVVASDINGIDDLIDENTGILVERGDIPKIANSIYELYTNKEKAQSLGLNLNKKITSEYSFEKMLEDTTSLYK